MAAETQRLVAEVSGRRGTVTDLYALAARIEAAYARAGYLLARVTVAPQQLTEHAEVRLVVVDGFIESVSVSALPGHVRRSVRASLQTLVGRTWLKLAEMERALVLAGGLPGVTLRSTLAAGVQPGGATLIVDGSYTPVAFSLSADNTLGHDFDDLETAPQLRLNDVFGLGELLYVSAYVDPQANIFSRGDPRRVLGGGAVLPLGINGLTLNPEFTTAETNPLVGAGVVRSRGEFTHASLTLAYPLIKTRREDLSLHIGVETIDETQTAVDLGSDLSRDRLRNLLMGVDWSKAVLAGAILGGRLELTQGVDALGARSQRDAASSGTPLSRQGVRPDFTKVEGNVRVAQQWPGANTGSLTARFGASLSGPLASSEEFNLAAPDAISSFPVGRLVADGGVALRAEFAHAFRPEPRLTVSPYAFAAGGLGFINRPTAVERSRFDAEAVGGGVRASLARLGFAGSLYGSVEVGRAMSDVPNLRDATRVFATVGVSF